MQFHFNQKKAAQAAAFILKLHGKPMNLIVLMKSLYLADRACLIETGYPITGDKMVSMDHGPVLSRIYDYTKWKPYAGNIWFEYISERNNNDLELIKSDPESDELSEFEMEILQQIHDKYSEYDPFVLSDMTHNLPEWEDPQGSSFPIDPADILRAEGKSPQEIRRATQTAEELLQFHALMHRQNA